METQVRTPQLVFMQPQRLIVPLFQRPYVWNLENQWAPLWRDVERLTNRLLAEPTAKHQSHFLGAVVVQQLQNPVGSLQARTVIDGQQRLTTLQLLLDALHAELLAVGAAQPALRLEALVKNPAPFCEQREDQFKVWPTNRDRAAFNSVMSAEPPISYGALQYSGERLVEAHRYFAEQAREWLQLDGADGVAKRAEKIEHTVRELLQLVVIDLTADENAQEIFETLNARGAGLTAADLIKNFVFQRLMEQGVDVEAAYEQHWKEFETGFWEVEVSFGRLRYSRSSIFLNHWLIARTGEEIVAREVFTRFKHYADFEAGVSMSDLVEQIARASAVYQRFIEGVSANNPIDRLQLFAYRTNTLESEVFKPIVLWLYDPELEPIPSDQVMKALEVLESWMVRRMLVRASTNSYTQIAAELVTQLRKGERRVAGDMVEGFFAGQSVGSRYWPDDAEVANELEELLAYQRLRRGRLRMVLEAIEDHRRGWKGAAEGLGGERVARGKFHIEHIMPRKWQTHWPIDRGRDSESERDKLVHTLGNLTLLTSKLNSKVSNAAWTVKRGALIEHDVLKVNGALVGSAGEAWTDEKIRARGQEMAAAVVDIWPVPEGHKSGFGRTEARQKRRVGLDDLIGAGLVEPGATIYARRKTLVGRTATVLPDGRIDVDGKAFDSLSAAARAISGKSENGWWFFNMSPTNKRAIAEVLQEYVDQTATDIDEDEIDEVAGSEDDDEDETADE
ncbi:DUF262 domain-containing protein [Mycobacterium sp. 21AC1]|uniref:GmrSD restriction endonuclease domain-containing protein n=1 Tax=[Mycobacterium] appelbergii TaxID=2939269 RepID=UPI002938EFE8|nr:DUF262 domain-containing protein [Mycobacterium sp. 21AC1]MDV3125276.1 DUF262 domain-containing protein [Mycobacterium sp. 21AC1]